MRSALAKITEALGAVREVERTGVGDVVADFGERRELETLQRIASEASDRVAAMQRSITQLLKRAGEEYALWQEERRFSPDGVQRTLSEVHGRAGPDPEGAKSRWVAEVVTALSRHQYAAALQIGEGFADADEELRSRLRVIAEGLQLSADGNAEAAQRAGARLDELLRERRELPVQTQAQIALLAAAVEQGAGRDDDAVRTLDAALEALPGPTVLEAERAGLSLLQGEVEDAAQRAHHATEVAPEQPDGYFFLGACSERGGDFPGAAEMYEEGCERSTLLTLHYLGTGATFLRPTGLLHLQRARRLRELGHVRAALQAADDAVQGGVAGRDPYPNAPAHQIRAELLAALKQPGESAKAAFQAGQEYSWNGDADRALALLEVAWSATPAIPDAGWYYADALCALSWPAGASVPDADRLAQAEQVWQARLSRLGPPTAESAWAYGTRAAISGICAFTPAGDFGASFWEAVLYLEKALVLQTGNAGLWGLSARYLRALGMDSAALESADRGFTLDPGHTEVLNQRLALLANAGEYDAAEETLNRIPGKDSDPWLLGVYAWILRHRGRYPEAVEALKLPLADGFDPGWYLELRADCLVHMGDLAAASRDLERLLEVDIHMASESTMRRALALVGLGRLDEAIAEVEQVKVDDQLSAFEVESVYAAVNLGRGDLDAARAAGLRCLQSARNVRETDDALSTWRTCLTLLAARGSDVVAASALVDQLAAWSQSRERQTLVQDADAEIKLASDRHAHDAADSHARIALAAIRARRMFSRDDNAGFLQAENILRGLVGTLFEPEASMAVTAVLQHRLTRAVSSGDERQAEQLYQELASRGQAPESPLAVVVAETLAATGRYDQALSVLAAARERGFADDQAAGLVDERIGDYALRARYIDVSLAALGRVAEAARGAGNLPAEVRARARMAVALAVGGDNEAIEEHLAYALRALREAGATAPSLTLGHELAAVAKAADASSAMGLLSESLRRAAERVDPADQAGHELLEAFAAAPAEATRSPGESARNWQ